MTWYGILFWVWLVVSTAIFVRRRLRAATLRRQARAAALAPVVAAASAPIPAPPASAAPPPAAAAAPAASDPAVSAPAASAPAASAPAPSVSSGLPTIAEIRSMQQQTVLTMLGGVQFPCDLYPVVAETGDLTVARRVVAATTGYGAAEVATALADELERLGFEVRGVSSHQAIATGPRGALHLTVHAANAPFASVPDHAVVVEIALI
ncbi:MAG: hypothetical protein MUE34_06460 [Acidimicrobiales bacterium]|nr:hypothetical protein [Acidimicrobiales bacterium]